MKGTILNRSTIIRFVNKFPVIFILFIFWRFKMDESYVTQLNNRINLLAVFLGLIVSIIILFIGVATFGGVISTGTNNALIYILTMVVAMIFFGSAVTGILGSKKFYDGFLNGGFLSLILIIFSSLVIGILLFVVVGIEASINTALNSLVSTSILGSFVSAPSVNLTSNILGTNSFTFQNIIELIFGLVFVVIIGGIGGGLGAYLKSLI